MESDKVQKLNIDMIDRELRPRLFEMIAIAGGEAYILSKETLSDEEGDEKLLLLLVGEGTSMLMEDSPKSLDGEADEIYKAMIIDDEAKDNLTKILLPKGKNRKESTGRPRVYYEDVAAAIFMENYIDKLSIKKISFRRNMSPTTVQKLLNEYRLELAEKIANGENITIMENDTENKLKILEWAISKSEGEKRRKYEQCYFKMNNI